MRKNQTHISNKPQTSNSVNGLSESDPNQTLSTANSSSSDSDNNIQHNSLDGDELFQDADSFYHSSSFEAVDSLGGADLFRCVADHDGGSHFANDAVPLIHPAITSSGMVSKPINKINF